ncbi:LysR family transcriptional regulator [Lysobacter panacisoli]|uniref:LysR family transcriptional regulator n=1 Tax=Lysobacter panacisoli TaxID=1255263 RepID=A0ABP9LCE6_9GAMM|nr:LysR family transcriptional regulator [Lysobacter panacisoli]
MPNRHAARSPIRPDTLAASFATSYAGVLAFVSVVNAGSFARAADRLGIGRSAVSRSVQKLEGQLGTRLLQRNTRNITLTSEGEMFYDACLPGVDGITRAMDEVRDLRDGPPQGHLRISAGQGFGRQVVAPLLLEFQARFPGISLELLLDEAPTDLAANRIDIAFREGPLEDSDVIARRLANLRTQVFASPDYARRHGLPTSVDHLAGHSCINLRLPSGRLQPWRFRVDGRARSFTPMPRLVFNDASLVLQSVLAGQGLAQLVACEADDELRAGRLVACLSDAAAEDSSHYLCYLGRKHQPKRVRAFVDFVIERVRVVA